MVTHVTKPTLRDFIYALMKNWASLVSGGLSVPFTILSIYLRNPNAKVIFALLAISGAFIASYKLWAQEREARIKNQDELETLTKTPPDGLEIVFGGDCKPYFEEQPTAILPGGKVVDRRYRVGVRNKNRAVVSKAQVVLENCEPSDAPGIHLEHPLQVMAHPGMSEVSVQPGDKASVFFDVICDETLDGKLRDSAFGLCYASSVKSFAIARGSYVLTLRVEGDGMQSRKKFRIFQESTTQMLTMREVAN